MAAGDPITVEDRKAASLQAISAHLALIHQDLRELVTAQTILASVALAKSGVPAQEVDGLVERLAGTTLDRS